MTSQRARLFPCPASRLSAGFLLAAMDLLRYAWHCPVWRTYRNYQLGIKIRDIFVDQWTDILNKVQVEDRVGPPWGSGFRLRVSVSVCLSGQVFFLVIPALRAGLPERTIGPGSLCLRRLSRRRPRLSLSSRIETRRRLASLCRCLACSAADDR